MTGIVTSRLRLNTIMFSRVTFWLCHFLSAHEKYDESIVMDLRGGYFIDAMCDLLKKL